MIKGISSTGRYFTTSGGNASTYVNGYSGAQGVGNMRYNTTTQNLEVFDGNTWIMMNMDYVNAGLTPEAEALLDWAREKRNEELAWESLAKDNQSVKIALNNLEQAKRQLDVTAKLAREYETTS
jgi:hypothetical protein